MAEVDPNLREKIRLLERLLNDSMDVHYGYGIPQYVVEIAQTHLQIPEDYVRQVFMKYDGKEDKKQRIKKSLHSL